jgi:hypothetical protein
MRSSLATLALLAVVALPAEGQQRQTDSSVAWSGRISPGRWIMVRNVNGSVAVAPSSGSTVEVVAIKRWRRGDPTFVRVETQKFGPNDSDVLVCALWGERSTCDERGVRTRGDRDDNRGRNNNNDVSVDFRVFVPRGVKVAMHTVNGDVIIDGVTDDVEAGTINGEVDVTTTGGRVNATNINGNVRARLGRVDSDGRMEFSSINGNVILEVSGDVGADVDLQTSNGSINTNFEMTVSGRIDRRRIRSHIGRPGGPKITMETVNGNVELRRR